MVGQTINKAEVKDVRGKDSTITKGRVEGPKRTVKGPI